MPVTAKRLASLASLTTDDLKVIAGLKGRTLKPGTLLDGSSETAESATLILSGWCARVALTHDGTRQITGILLPGDGFGLGGAPWAGDRLSVLSLTPCVIVDATSIRNLIRLRSPAHSKLIEACHQLAWLEQTYALNHIVRLAGRTAYERVAHFIAELYIRMRDVGLVSDGTFATPIPQQVVADALGLSGVHLNRVARKLRSDGLVDFPRGVVYVRDLDMLLKVARFDGAAAS